MIKGELKCQAKESHNINSIFSSLIFRLEFPKRCQPPEVSKTTAWLNKKAVHALLHFFIRVLQNMLLEEKLVCFFMCRTTMVWW